MCVCCVSVASEYPTMKPPQPSPLQTSRRAHDTSLNSSRLPSTVSSIITRVIAGSVHRQPLFLPGLFAHHSAFCFTPLATARFCPGHGNQPAGCARCQTLPRRSPAQRLDISESAAGMASVQRRDALGPALSRTLLWRLGFE